MSEINQAQKTLLNGLATVAAGTQFAQGNGAGGIVPGTGGGGGGASPTWFSDQHSAIAAVVGAANVQSGHDFEFDTGLSEPYPWPSAGLNYDTVYASGVLQCGGGGNLKTVQPFLIASKSYGFAYRFRVSTALADNEYSLLGVIRADDAKHVYGGVDRRATGSDTNFVVHALFATGQLIDTGVALDTAWHTMVVIYDSVADTWTVIFDGVTVANAVASTAGVTAELMRGLISVAAGSTKIDKFMYRTGLDTSTP